MRSEDIFMEMGEIIKALRLEKGLTQEQLGNLIGVQKSAIRKYESGAVQNMKRSSIQKLAEFFHVSPAYLMGFTSQRNGDLPSNIYTVEGLIDYDVIGTISAGYGGIVDEISTGEKIQIPTSMLKGHNPDDFFALRVKGASMYPRLLEGDVVLCLRCNSVDSGSLAVVLYNGDEATVKKVNYVSGENWLELIPANPEYPTKRIEGADLELCRILGLVVKLIRDL